MNNIIASIFSILLIVAVAHPQSQSKPVTATDSSTQPSTQPATQPATQPTSQPTTQPVSFSIAPDTTVSITVGGQVVGQGKIELIDAQSLFDANTQQDAVLGISTIKNLEVHPTNIEYTQSFNDIYVNFHLTPSNEDLIVSAHIFNNSKKPLNWFCFNTPIFTFAQNPTGMMPSWSWSYIQASGANHMHPSYAVPFGGAYANDGNFGIGFSTVSHLKKQSMFNAIWGGDGIIPARCEVQFMGDAHVEPGASKTLDFTIRVSANTNWKHLLANYYNTYKQQMGEQRYVSDHRPWSFFAAADASYVTPADPYGFNGDSRRFDLPQGVAAFVSDYGPQIKGVGQGMMLWIPQGINPRGAQYRPDFDCFPAPIAANFPTLIKGFTDLGLTVGMESRPSQMIWPATYTSDNVTTLDGRNPDQMNALCTRYDAMTKLGVTAFYCDSCGINLNDFYVMDGLRTHIGPNVITLTEFTNDLTAIDSGAFVEPTDDQGDTYWLGSQAITILLWLNPDMEIVSLDNKGIGPESIYAHHMSYMTEDWGFSSWIPRLTPLNQQYLNGPKWK